MGKIVTKSKADCSGSEKKLTSGVVSVSTETKEEKKIVDLVDLFAVLFKNKYIILVVSFFFAIIAAIYAFNAQEWWSARAKVMAPNYQDISELNNEIRKFKPIFDVYQEDGTIFVSEEFDDLMDQEEMFKDFVNHFNSRTNKRNFLLEDPHFQNYLQSKGISTDLEREKVFDTWSKKLNVISDNGGTAYTLVMQSLDADSSVDMLSRYIKYISSMVFNDMLKDLESIISAKKIEIKQQVSVFEMQAKIELDVEKQKTKHALEIAKSAGIVSPIQYNNGQDLFSINLGAAALSARVDVLNNIKNLGLINHRLQTSRAKLEYLEQQKVNKAISFNTFRFIEGIEKPVRKDKPRKGILIFLGAIIGMIIGSLLVLMKFTVKKSTA